MLDHGRDALERLRGLLLGAAEGVLGYYRYPALAGDTLIFAAEGDLWVVGVDGGLARRLTTHPGEETDIEVNYPVDYPNEEMRGSIRKMPMVKCLPPPPSPRNSNPKR